MRTLFSSRKFLFSSSVVAVLVLSMVLVAMAQANKAATQAQTTTANSAQIARGKYIVNDVAMCTMCHSPRTASGDIDQTKLLMGAPTFLRPAQPMADWPNICPRIGGTPPGTDQEMVTLLTTGIWKTGQPLRQPMPQFRMTKEDAEAVVAYLKSLKNEY
jgi:mono/diheme cytochrome c family protein